MSTFDTSHSQSSQDKSSQNKSGPSFSTGGHPDQDGTRQQAPIPATPESDSNGGEQPFHSGVVDDSENGFETNLRPPSFREFVGQERVTENLLISIEAAKERHDVLDHVLLSGMPGLGKTTLSMLISEAMGVKLHKTSGPVLEHGGDLVGFLTNLERGDVLFIDEIHRMSRAAEEYLYSAMEDYQVDIVIDKGADARTYSISIQPFTLVGATTREGLLSAPFRSRFGIQEKLETYSDTELAKIIVRSANLLSSEIETDTAVELAKRSRGTPRYANRFLRRVRDISQYRRRKEREEENPNTDPIAQRLQGGAALYNSNEPLVIRPSDVFEGLERLGVDENGLDRIDRRILQVLIENGERPIGLKTLSVSVGEEDQTIEDVYEPYLIQKGLLLKTPRGRLATQYAFDLLKESSREVRGTW